MEYKNIEEGIFLKRPNRFTAHVNLQGKEEICHVKNTGRLAELLLPGAKVYVSLSDNPKRKTKYSLIAVEKEGVLYNIDSQAPNHLVYEWIQGGNLIPNLTLLQKEKTYGNSRFDLYAETEEKKIFIEVKGVTLNQEGIGLFPDAPTKRGEKHVQELCEAVKEGYEAGLIFVVKFQPVSGFAPNEGKHPAFAQSLREAKEQGVWMKAVCCEVSPDQIYITREIPVLL